DRRRADIHDGPGHKRLQAKAGYIDARPHMPLGEVFLQRTAGPYIWVNSVGPSQAVAPSDVRFAPKADKTTGASLCPLCARSDPTLSKGTATRSARPRE